MIEVAETKESLGFLDRGGDRPLSDAHDLSRVHADLAISNNDTQVFNGSLVKGAFFWLDVEIKFAKALQDNMCEVTEGGKRIMKDEDIVKIDDNMALVEEIFKDVIHKV